MNNILLIDDSTFMRSIIKAIVKKHGYTVIGEAENGRIGLEKYKDLRPDAVILDVTMDEMNGLTALKHIINFDPNAVVIIVSSLSGQKWLYEESISLGAKAVLSKPIDPEKLYEILKQVVSGHNSEKTLLFVENKQGSHSVARLFEIDPKLLEVFLRDAKKAIITLQETITNGDINHFTIHAHAIKSALANIGENEKADLAFALEEAGRKADLSYIQANLERFIKDLETLVAKLS